MMGNIRFIIVVLLFAGAKHICGDGDVKDIKGRLLTPEEGCGISKVKNVRIIGGTEAPVGAFPWLALLGQKYRVSGQITDFFYCAGSLITSKHVLTAAHCLRAPNTFFVRLGEHDINRTDDGLHQDISVNRVVKHAQYHAHFKINDIGMIELKRDVTFSDRIRPICLPVDEPYRSREFNDANPFVAGWGSTTERAAINDSSNVLLQLQVPVVDNDTCRKLVFKAGAVYANIQIKDHVLCAGMKGGEGFWVGDSGGPLMLPIHQNGTFPYYQIGIVSFSFHAAKENVPDIYSRVQYHADWIKKQLEDSTTNETKAVEWKSNL